MSSDADIYGTSAALLGAARKPPSRVRRRRTVSARSLVTGMVPCSEFLVSLLPHIISSADQLHLSERFNEGHP